MNFDLAVALSFPLSTAVGALHVYGGMEKPGEGDSNAHENEKVLIWGAGGAVGGYARFRRRSATLDLLTSDAGTLSNMPKAYAKWSRH